MSTTCNKCGTVYDGPGVDQCFEHLTHTAFAAIKAATAAMATLTENAILARSTGGALTAAIDEALVNNYDIFSCLELQNDLHKVKLAQLPAA